MIKKPIYTGIAIFGLFSFSAHCMEVSISRKNTSAPQLPALESIMSRKEFDQKINTVKKSKRLLNELAVMATNKKINHFKVPQEIFNLIISHNIKVTSQGLKELDLYAGTCKEWNKHIVSFRKNVFPSINFIKSKLPNVKKGISAEADKVLDHNECYDYLMLYKAIPALPYIDPKVDKILLDSSIAKHFIDNKTQDVLSITKKTLETGYNLICKHIKNMENNHLFAANYGVHLERACQFFDPEQLKSLINNHGYTHREEAVCKKILNHYLSLKDSDELTLNLNFDFGARFELQIKKKEVKECQKILYAHKTYLEK